MFCNQCEQTAKGTGCDKSGVCGKQPDVAALQDLLVYALAGMSQVACAARQAGIVDRVADVMTSEGLFATVTNVDFDPERFDPLIRRVVALREELAAKLLAAGGKVPAGEAAAFRPAGTLAGLVAQGEKVGTPSYPAADGDVLSLKQTLLDRKSVV